jgi:hypothetical protein
LRIVFICTKKNPLSGIILMLYQKHAGEKDPPYFDLTPGADIMSRD